jgi:hypothetical protein
VGLAKGCKDGCEEGCVVGCEDGDDEGCEDGDDEGCVDGYVDGCEVGGAEPMATSKCTVASKAAIRSEYTNMSTCGWSYQVD